MKKKVRLQIGIDALLLEEAKAYAANNKLTLSQLVSTGLQEIIKSNKKENLLDILDRSPVTSTNFPDDFDFKRAYYEERKEKYGFGS